MASCQYVRHSVDTRLLSLASCQYVRVLTVTESVANFKYVGQC